ncbi:MAG: sugar phosphate isomerase/epimerase [Oscillospiraceae bacterium]|nr:sugar phosphate isomerase/epimerase [Oscillospiraceae bacterium]
MKKEISKDKILCSTGTFIGRLNDFDYRLIGELAKKIDCGGFEMMIEPFWNSAEQLNGMAEYISRLNLNFVTLHADKSIGELFSSSKDGDSAEALRRFDLNCMTASAVGARLIVLHLWGGLDSDKHIGSNIKMLPELLEIAGRHDVTLTLENIVCSSRNALEHLCEIYRLYKNDAFFTIDVRHAEFHKNLKQTCQTEYLWENVLHTHIADYKGDLMDWTKLRPVLRPGTGDVDFAYFFGFLKKIKYNGSFTLEAGARTDDGTAVDFDKINESLRFICENFMGAL